MSKQSELVIVDPLDHKNNVAERLFQFSNVKSTLMICYIVAKDNCECGCHYIDNDNTTNNGIESKEHCILNKIFKTIKRLTDNFI
jgi:hypothetical protein